MRPLVTASTAGTGNWLVSLLEDVVAFFMSLLSLLIPLLAGLAFLAFVLLLVWVWRRRQQKRLGY